MSNKTISIVGAGQMARGLVRRFTEAGHPVLITDRVPQRAERIVREDAVGGCHGASAVSPSRALESGILILALPQPEIIEFAKTHADALVGKILIDVSNTPEQEPGDLSAPSPTNGAEDLLLAAPGSRVVKAFNTVTAASLLAGELDGSVLDVFVASDDEKARTTVIGLLRGTGLRGIDAGVLADARLLDQLLAFTLDIGRRYGIDADCGIKFLPRTGLINHV